MLCNFSVRTQKHFLKTFFKKFAYKKLKKPPQKFAYLWQLKAFFLSSTDCPKQPRISFPCNEFFYTTISCRIFVSNPNILEFMNENNNFIFQTFNSAWPLIKQKKKSHWNSRPMKVKSQIKEKRLLRNPLIFQSPMAGGIFFNSCTQLYPIIG